MRTCIVFHVSSEGKSVRPATRPSFRYAKVINYEYASRGRFRTVIIYASAAHLEKRDEGMRNLCIRINMNSSVEHKPKWAQRVDVCERGLWVPWFAFANFGTEESGQAVRVGLISTIVCCSVGTHGSFLEELESIWLLVDLWLAEGHRLHAHAFVSNIALDRSNKPRRSLGRVICVEVRTRVKVPVGSRLG